MKFQKLLAVVCATALLASTGANAAPIDVARSEIASDSALVSQWMSDQMKVAVPFNSTSGNVIPHQVKIFGVELGVEGVASDSKMDVDALHNLGTQVIDTTKIDMFSRLPVPSILGQAKVGLPFGFDAGVRVGGLPATTLDKNQTHLSVNNTIWGLDLRKVLIEEGILHPFGLTLGANFTCAKGSFKVSQPYKSQAPVEGFTSSLMATGTGQTDWDTKSVGLQVLLHKTFLVVTPYVGLSANKNFGSVDTTITTSGTETISGIGNPVDVSGSGHATPNGIDTRALAGLELSLLPFIRLGLYGEYAGTQNMAASLGLRIQFR
jgi:hypothetical protein